MANQKNKDSDIVLDIIEDFKLRQHRRTQSGRKRSKKFIGKTALSGVTDFQTIPLSKVQKGNL